MEAETVAGFAWYGSLAGIAGTTTFIVNILKRILARHRTMNALPTWVYASAVAGLLTYVANQVWHTLPGDNVWDLVMQAVILAATASGFHTWFQEGAIVQPIGDTTTARDTREAHYMRNNMIALLLVPLTAATLLTGCAPRSGTDTAPSELKTAARYTADLTKGIKVIAQTLVASEVAQAPLSESQKAFYVKAYIATYDAAGVAEQAADLLQAAEAVTATPELIDRLNALLPLLDGKVSALIGIDMSPANRAELVKLVANVSSLLRSVREAIPQIKPAPVPVARALVWRPQAA